MEFHIGTHGLATSTPSTTHSPPSILRRWPIDPADASLRIAAELGSPELLALLTRAGYPVDWKQLEQVPSVCCGACGG